MFYPMPAVNKLIEIVWVRDNPNHVRGKLLKKSRTLFQKLKTIRKKSLKNPKNNPKNLKKNP